MATFEGMGFASRFWPWPSRFSRSGGTCRCLRRAASGRSVPRVVEVDINADPVLHARHLETIPVIQCGSDELPLAIRPGAVRRFLARVLDGVPA